MSTSIELRPYQIATLASIRDHIHQGVHRVLVALPTGTGKTVCFAHIPSFLGLTGKWLVLAHREELLDQALDKFRLVNPTMAIGIEQAQRRARDAYVVLASVPTLQRSRLAAIDPSEYAGVIVDEAHHATADSYLAIFEHFGLFEKSNTRPLIGFTATPKRGDDVGLSEVFQAISYEATLRQMIKQGFLSDISGIRVNTGASLAGVKTRCGDFSQNDLADAVDTDERNMLIVKSYREYAKNRKALAFCVGVNHAERLSQSFIDGGFRAASISGNTPKDERRHILKEFKYGELDVITNCGVLTEGYDEPSVECILMSRPTQSSLLYTQIVGRGTRLFPEKKDCLVIDFVDASTRHSVSSIASLFGLPKELNLKGKKALEVKEELEQIELKYPWIDTNELKNIDDLKVISTKIEFFNSKTPAEIAGFTNLSWMHQLDGGYRLSLPKGESIEVLPTRLDGWQVNFHGESENPFTLPEVKDLSLAIQSADLFVKEQKKDSLVLLDTRSSWRKQPASEKQIQLLQKMKMNHPEKITKGQAASMLTLAFQYKKHSTYKSV